MPAGLYSAGRPHSGRGYTLLELLVSLAIIAVLVAVVTVSVGRARAAARGVLCASNLKTVAGEFFLFADDYSRARRPDRATPLGRLFRIEDFQEKLYGIDEYWPGGPGGLGGGEERVMIRPADQPLMCPSAPAHLEKRRGLPCSQYAVGPTRNVSVGFNMRLDQVSMQVGGWSLLRRTRLTSDILRRADVPLAFDVAGAEAELKGVLPYYSAPAAGDSGAYADGRFWFPGLRHAGRFNVAFIGGHVLSLHDPGERPQAEWRYQPPLR